jgi:hypothetical protein
VITVAVMTAKETFLNSASNSRVWPRLSGKAPSSHPMNSSPCSSMKYSAMSIITA